MKEKWYLFLKKHTRVTFLILTWVPFKVINGIARIEYRWRGATYNQLYRIARKWDDYKYEQERGGL